MEIDNKVIDLFTEGKAQETSNDRRESSREKWLSALERESFDISDDTLREQSGRPGLPGMGASREQAHLPAGHDTNAAILAKHGITPQRPGNASHFSTAAQVDFNFAAPNPMSRAVPGPTVPGPAQPGQGGAARNSPGSTPPQPGIASPSGYSQRYEALLSQTRFMDVNIQLTQSKDGVTLWIRDFKNKYANEVFHWTRSLENLLREKGQSISRIMLNGKALPTISAIFGGEDDH